MDTEEEAAFFVVRFLLAERINRTSTHFTDKRLVMNMKPVFAIVASVAVALSTPNHSLASMPERHDHASENSDLASMLEPFVEMLDELKGRTPTSAQLSKIGIAWKRLPSTVKEQLRGDVISLACAGFLVIDDMTSFEKSLSAIPDKTAFRAETAEPCSGCGGTGIVRSRCQSCSGTGRCSRCKGQGSISGPRLAGMGAAASMSCSSCHGSGSCPACNGGVREVRHDPCNGSGYRTSRAKCLAAFETHRAKAAKEAFSDMQKAKGLVLRNGEWISPAEAAERERRAEEERNREAERRAEQKRRAEEKKERDAEFAEYQRSRGLVLIGGEWMTPGSCRKIPLFVLQKLPVKGITMMRPPMSGEHGGLLCRDLDGEVGCVIVSDVEWDNAEEGQTYRFDVYRCGVFSYATQTGDFKTVRLDATDLDTALEEIEDQRHSERFRP